MFVIGYLSRLQKIPTQNVYLFYNLAMLFYPLHFLRLDLFLLFWRQLHLKVKNQQNIKAVDKRKSGS